MIMQNLKFFEDEVRVVEIGLEKRMSAIDACRAMIYSDPATAWTKIKERNPEIAEICLPVKMVGNDGISRETDTLSLEGIANLCMIAKTEKARDFRRWARGVLADVIEHKMQSPPMTFLDTAKALVQALEQNQELANQLAIAAPKAESFDSYMDSEGDFLPNRSAKINGFKPQKTFFQYLENGGWAFRDSKTGAWVASAKALKAGYLVMKAGSHMQGDKEVKHEQMYVTKLGHDYFSKVLKAAVDKGLNK